MLLIKIKQQDLLHDGKAFLIQLLILRECMICLIFPSASQLALID